MTRPSFFLRLRASVLPLLCAWGLAGGLGAGTQYIQEPRLDACQQWDEAIHGLERGRLDERAARARFQGLWPLIRDAGPAYKGAPRWAWMFPLPGYDTDCYGQSYDVEGYRFLDGARALGFAGLRLYIRDAGRRGVDDRTNKPAPVVSATDGVVVSSEQYWKPGGGAWGDYAVVYDRRGGLFFLYGGLARIRVSPGQLVLQGEVIGWLGRTGDEVRAEELGTQLRFEVHTFDDGLFYPVYPGRALRDAGHTEWPIPEGIIRPRFKPPKGQAQPQAPPTF